tara:strand:- start:1933 stop:2859 length:927 start_codon:yes stop_codon:yes gene_type:complete
MATPIYYVSNLNQDVNNTSAGLFTGAVASQPSTSGTDFTAANSTNGTVSLTDLAEFFMIKTTAAESGDTDATSNVTGVAKVAQGSLASGGSGFANPTLTTGRPVYLGVLASAVFGSAQSTDFFSNADAIMDGFETAMGTMRTNLNDSTNGSASEELYNAMLLNYPSRFSLAHGSTVSGGSTGVHSSVTATGSSSSATCVVEVELDAANSVARITRTAAASGTFTTSDNLTIANGGGTGVDVTITGLNSIQVAILNNSLTSNTALPFEAGDTVRVVFQVDPNASQKAADGSDIADDAYPYTVFVDYLSS